MLTRPVANLSSSRTVYWNAIVTRGSSYQRTSWSWRALQPAAASAIEPPALRSFGAGPTPVSVIQTVNGCGQPWAVSAASACSTGSSPPM